MKIFYLLVFVLLIEFSGFSQSKFENLVPHFYSLQYAGSIGYLSVGAGYNMGEKMRFSVHYGFVPEKVGGPLHITAAKFIYSPWQLELNPKVKLNLFDMGVFFSYHFGSQFSSSWPSTRYPDGYYWWRTAMRYHLAVENSIRFYPTEGVVRSISLYVEHNTNDLYVVSYVKNTSTLSLADIFKLGIGARIYLR